MGELNITLHSDCLFLCCIMHIVVDRNMAFSRRSNEQIVGKFWILVMFETWPLIYVF